MHKSLCLLATMGFLFIRSASAQVTIHPPKVIPPIYLVQSKEVGEELQLTDEQKAKIATLPQKPGPMKEGESLKDVMAKIPKTDKEWEDAYTKLKAILTPAQNERLGQLHRQYNGIYGISYPEYQKQFGVTTKQIDEIAEVYAAVLEEIVNSRALPTRDASGSARIRITDEDSAKAKAKALEAAKRVLTAEQMKKWEDSLGKPFQFPKTGG